MKITEFTFNNPNSDGDMQLEGSVLLENNTDFDVEFVTISTTVLNHAGVTVGGNKEQEDSEFISAKSSGEVDLNFGWSYHKDFFNSQPSGGASIVKKQFVDALVEIAKIDGEIKESEKAWLNAICEIFEVDIPDV